MSERPWLRALAARAGIEASYCAIDGSERHTSDETCARLVAAMGLEAEDEDAARRTCEAWDLRNAAQAGAPATDASGQSAASAANKTRCHPPPPHRIFGLLAQLYAVRTASDWGAGDLGSLRRVVDWAAQVGADFVGANPLNALDLRGREASPYSPSSRLFVHALYLDVEAVPELSSCAPAREFLASPTTQAELLQLRAAPRVEHARVLRLKLDVVRALHACFEREHVRRDSERGRAFRRFVDLSGEALDRFATFGAIADALGQDDFRRWPNDLREPGSAAVTAFRSEHAERVDLHRYLQFELDRQLADVSAHARSRGLAVGLYTDLAVGCAPGGADVWARPELFAVGASIGCPPDPFSTEGQNWTLAPVNPWRSSEERHDYFRAILSRTMAHAGALRIDHVMGLRRQYWVPEGMPAIQGAYVRCPEAEWLGIVASESAKSGCVVVGEDLGTVPEGLRDVLAERGILRSQVMCFERDERGEFRAPAEYAREALVTANTHDLPTLRGLWDGRDLALRRERGLIADDNAMANATAEQLRTREALVGLLRRVGSLAPNEWPDHVALCRAVHLTLAETPCAVLGIALDDLGEESEAVNLPGAPDPERQNWTRRMAHDLSALAGREEPSRWLEALAARRSTALP